MGQTFDDPVMIVMLSRLMHQLKTAKCNGRLATGFHYLLIKKNKTFETVYSPPILKKKWKEWSFESELDFPQQ